MIKVVIESLGTELKMCTYDMSITAYLGGIYLQHTQFKGNFWSTEVQTTAFEQVSV